MRESYHHRLEEVVTDLVVMSDHVAGALDRATLALLGADRDLAEEVITADADIDAAHHAGEERILDLIARQAPVAGELRALTAGLRMLTDLERAGDHAVHIAKVARRRHPRPAVAPELRSTIADLGQTAEHIITQAGRAIATRDIHLARTLHRDDDIVDDLQRRLFGTVLDPHWPHGAEAAIDAALLGRYYERYADHGVSAARHVIYLATGTYPQPA